mmetsp:Transcript_76680/g.211836  ORF Transcript_76680/g.211836 Transcript_76680/m.211836 type:complete len:227 (+) Transcript_76680:326-1006(+)
MAAISTADIANLMRDPATGEENSQEHDRKGEHATCKWDGQCHCSRPLHKVVQRPICTVVLANFSCVLHDHVWTRFARVHLVQVHVRAKVVRPGADSPCLLHEGEEVHQADGAREDDHQQEQVPDLRARKLVEEVEHRVVEGCIAYVIDEESDAQRSKPWQQEQGNNCPLGCNSLLIPQLVVQLGQALASSSWRRRDIRPPRSVRPLRPVWRSFAVVRCRRDHTAPG